MQPSGLRLNHQNYYVFYRCEDEPYCKILVTEADLLAWLNSDDVMESNYNFVDGYTWGKGVNRRTPGKPIHLDLMNFPARTVLIIHGQGVFPTPVKTVTQYKL